MVLLSFISCTDSTRSRKIENREKYPPKSLFKNIQLQAAQEMYDGNLNAFSKTIQKNSQIVNEMSPIKGYTLLMYAAIIEDLEAMKILLENGADPDIIIPHLSSSPLNHAVGTNNYKMLNLLIAHNVNMNPAVGRSPLQTAMFLGSEKTERAMIDFLLSHGANINHHPYLGDNILEVAVRNNLDTAIYFLNKGGNPRIEGTTLIPMATYIDWKEVQYQRRKNPNTEYFQKLMRVKSMLQNQYKITFPVKKDLKEEAKLRVRLYENLSEKDKRSVNFNKNYGENRYRADLGLMN